MTKSVTVTLVGINLVLSRYIKSYIVFNTHGALILSNVHV